MIFGVTLKGMNAIFPFSSPRFKQRFSFIIPPVNDLFAILDSVKVSLWRNGQGEHLSGKK